jgi:FAD/FMN-containing dehydrogenase
MDVLPLLPQLTGLLGAGGLLQEPDALVRYSRDWSGDYTGRPLAVARPGTTAELAETVRLCAAAGVPVVPQGGNTGLVRGGLPSAAGSDLIISLERLNRVRRVDPVNFSMIAEAGCVLADLQAAAMAENMLLPLSLGAQGSCQIGGNVATNAGGVNVLRYGMARELVLGLEVVLPDGRVWNGLRSLRKDNTGYDLKQLFIGSEGTLGIITAIALKLFPRPTQVQTALLGLDSIESAIALYGAARRDLSDLLSAFELMPRTCLDLTLAAFPDLREPFARKLPVTVLVEASASGLVDLAAIFDRFLGTQLEQGRVLDGSVAQSTAQAKGFWRLREDLVEAQHRAGRHLRTDISVTISDMAGFLEAADAAVSQAEPSATRIAYGHVGDGNIHYNIIPPPDRAPDEVIAMIAHLEEILFKLVDRFAGSISAEHGIGRLKRAHFLERLSPTEMRLMHAVKSGIDPAGLMNPGVILI